MNVIYFHFTNKHTLNIVDYLYKEYQWNPVYIGGIRVDGSEAVTRYKSCIFQDSISIRQAIFDYEKVGDMIPVDSNVIESLSKYLINALSFQEDSTGFNFSFAERKRYFYDVLNYWNTVLLNIKPEAVVFFTRPHTPAEYPLYLLCQHYYKINVLFINPVPFFNSNYHIVSNVLECEYSPFIEIYKAEENLVPSDKVLNYINDIKNKKDITPHYIQRVFNAKDDSIRAQIFRAVREIFSGIVRFNLFKSGSYAYKINKKPYYSLSSRASVFSGVIHHLKMSINNNKLGKYYKSISRQFDPTKKYVFFSASYQPEATTSLLAGVFEDQFIAIDMLSYVIPSDWVIYYKEHPSIFLMSHGRKGSLSRSKAYYKKLKENPKIRIIPADTSQTNLIDHSILVSTAGGTVGWESIVRGKPVISFGNAWFHGCASVMVAKSISDVKNAIDKIVGGFVPDQNDINSYAAAIEQVSVPGMIHRDFSENVKQCKNPQYEMERIGEALHKAFRSKKMADSRRTNRLHSLSDRYHASSKT